MTSNQDNLSTLSTNGAVPTSRIGSVSQAKNIYDLMWYADEKRAKKRQLVKGLIDGNAPYRQEDLRAEGRDYQCNVNWRVSEAYLTSAVGAFYDLFGEAPTYANIRTNHGTPEEQETWSRSITIHFDWLLRNEPCFDYDTQVSQGEMVLFGAGPFVFEDEYDWRPTAINYNQLKVPERAKSDTSRWEIAAIEIEYLPDRLYDYIKDPAIGRQRGWDVEQVKKSIINAHPDTEKGGQYKTWEWHQQELKNGSLGYSFRSRTIRVVHMLYKEFPNKGESEGRISHVIFLADNQQAPVDFLFKKIGRYESWNECVHAMYYDRGGGGYHHSVTGMGTKMYSAFEYQNRLLCNLADKAFSPKIMFRPTTATSAELFGLQQFGDYGVLTEGFEAMQMPTAGIMDEGIAFHRETSNMMEANLGQYRQSSTQESGEKPTATQVREDASKDARLQKTQMNRYYKQLDALYAEMFRRACNPSLKKNMRGGERAQEFRERCKRDGVPNECLNKIEYVRASRVVGQGSEFLRQQSIEFLFATVLPRLPESGQENLVSDMIAARAGQSAVERYLPKDQESKLPSDQQARAMSQVADMKTGTPAIPTETQNPLIFAVTFINASEKAIESLQQGADKAEIASFLELSGQAAATHIKRMSGDRTREPIVKDLSKRLGAIGRTHDQLVQNVQEEQQASQQKQAEMQQQFMEANGELALKKMKTEAGIQDKFTKTRAGLIDKSMKSKQDMTIKDMTAAQDIRIKARESAAKTRAQSEPEE